MPLIQGKSPASFSKNVKTEYEAGKPLKQSLAIAYMMKKKAKKMAYGGDHGEICRMCAGGSCPKHMMASGGMVREEEESGWEPMPEEHDRMNEPAEHEDEDMIDRIMRKRMSEGGMVANEDHGPMDDRLAGFKQNEFDDLALRDDLDSSYDGANSGDMDGDEQEDEDRRDIISRIMKSRAMKDRMPIAGYGMSYGRNK